MDQAKQTFQTYNKYSKTQWLSRVCEVLDGERNVLSESPLRRLLQQYNSGEIQVTPFDISHHKVASKQALMLSWVSRNKTEEEWEAVAEGTHTELENWRKKRVHKCDSNSILTSVVRKSKESRTGPVLSDRSPTSDLSDPTRPMTAIEGIQQHAELYKKGRTFERGERQKGERRARLPWDKKEVDILFRGIARYGVGKWSLIRQRYPYFAERERSAKDICDKYKGMLKNSLVETQERIRKETQWLKDNPNEPDHFLEILF